MSDEQNKTEEQNAGFDWSNATDDQLGRLEEKLKAEREKRGQGADMGTEVRYMSGVKFEQWYGDQLRKAKEARRNG